MKKFSFNSFVRKQQPKGVFIEATYGNLGIGISASALPMASALQKNCFCLQNFFFLNRTFMLFLVLSYSISTTLLQILISLRFSIHPLKGVYWCSRKRLFEHSVHSQAFLGLLQSSLEHLFCTQGFIRAIWMSVIRHKKLNLSIEF